MTPDLPSVQPAGAPPPGYAKAKHPKPDLPPPELAGTALPGGIVVLHQVVSPDGQDHIVSISQGCATLWELDPEVIVHQPEVLWQAIHPDDRSTIRQLMAHAVETLTPWFGEWRIVTPSGQQKWLQGMGRPQRLANGDVAWDAVMLDVSERGRLDAERKQAEQALKGANQQMQAFLDNTPALVHLFDANGRYLKVNRATADSLGLLPAEVEGQLFSDLFPSAVVKRFMERVNCLLVTQSALTVEDHLYLNGEQRVMRSVLFPVTVENGQVTVMGSVATDITALVEAQMTLRRQAEEERLIRTMTQHIRESLDLDSILQTTVTEVRQFLQTDRVLIYRFNPDWSGDMIVEAVVPPWRAVLGSTVKDPCFAGNLVTQYRHGRVGQIDDIETQELSTCHKKLLAEFQVKANLTIGIKGSSEELWGLLCVHHCQGPRRWQPQEIALLGQLADQVAIALQQSQLVSQAADLAQQEKLLNDMVKAISDSLDLQTLMQRTADAMLPIFKTSRSMVLLCQATDQNLVHTATASQPGIDNLKNQVVPLQGNPHAEQVLAQEAPVAVDDVTQCHLMAPVLALAQSLDIGAMLAVSIRYRGAVKGILSVHQCGTPRRWNEAEIHLIKRLADHLAIAIHQAELYTQAQRELAERKRLEARLRHDASHDRLTGLPNRTLLLDRLAQSINQLHEHCSHHLPLATLTTSGDHPALCCAHQFAVLFLDLDRFKVINDSLGHAIGDQLLRVVADRLQTCLQPPDMAARLGGDEFVVLLTQLSDIQAAIAMAQTIHTTLETPVQLEGHEVFIHASIGIALSTTTYTDPNQVLRDADIAMYKAKGSNREYAIFDAPMHTLVVQQMQLENDLRRALERDELRLHYQPIVDLATGAVQGFEALVRWQHPQRGLVPPLDFIPIAENTGLITTLDLWTLNEACRQLNRWHQQFPHSRALTVSVNLSGKQFVRPDLIQQIDAALAHNRLEGRHLKVEITESVLIQNAPMAIDLLQDLRQRHIQICMDDFGTGYSSLSYLHRFPIDVLKIDKSFITNLPSADPVQGDYEIVKAIIGLAISLNLAVVAEGIETADQQQYLKAHRCHGGQGYYFSKPMAVDAATAFIAQI